MDGYDGSMENVFELLMKVWKLTANLHHIIFILKLLGYFFFKKHLVFKCYCKTGWQTDWRHQTVFNSQIHKLLTKRLWIKEISGTTNKGTNYQTCWISVKRLSAPLLPGTSGVSGLAGFHSISPVGHISAQGRGELQSPAPRWLTEERWLQFAA